MGGSASKGAAAKKDGAGAAATPTSPTGGGSTLGQGDSGSPAGGAVLATSVEPMPAGNPQSAASDSTLQTQPLSPKSPGVDAPKPAVSATPASAAPLSPSAAPGSQSQSSEDLENRFGKNGPKKLGKDESNSLQAAEAITTSKSSGPQKPTTNPDIPVQSAWSMDTQSKDKAAADQRLQKIPDPPPPDHDEPDSPHSKGKPGSTSPINQGTKPKHEAKRHYDDDDDDDDNDDDDDDYGTEPKHQIRNPSPPIYIPNPIIFPTQRDDPDDEFDLEFGRGKRPLGGTEKEKDTTNEWEDAEEILKDSMSIKSKQNPSAADQMKDVAFTDNNSPQASGRGAQNMSGTDKRASDKRSTDKQVDGKEGSDGSKSARKGRSTSTGKKAAASERSNSKEKDSNPNDHFIMGKDVFDPNKFRQANQKHNNAAEDIFRYPTYGSYILKSKEADSSPHVQVAPKDSALASAVAILPNPGSVPSYPNLPGGDTQKGGFTHEEEHLLDDILSLNRSS